MLASTQICHTNFVYLFSSVSVIVVSENNNDSNRPGSLPPLEPHRQWRQSWATWNQPSCLGSVTQEEILSKGPQTMLFAEAFSYTRK